MVKPKNLSTFTKINKMKLTTRRASYGDFIEVKIDETETDIFKNGDEADDFIQNLLDVIEDVCKLRGEGLFEYLEEFYNIEIKAN